MRPDLAPEPAAVLFRRITPQTAPPGIALPGRPASVNLDASLGPASLRLAPAAVTVSIQDADGNVYAVPAGTLADDGNTHVLTAAVGQALYPLRLIAITLRYPLPAAATPAAVLAIAGFAGWQATATSPGLAALLQNSGSTTGPARLPSAGIWQAKRLSFSPGFSRGRISGELTLTAPMTAIPAAIPGIATRAYLDSAGVAQGSIVRISVTGVTIPVRIVAAVTAFPAISGPGGAVIVDLASVQDALAAMSLPPAPVAEWWLSAGPAGLTARIPPGSSVITPGQLAAAMLADPLSAAAQQAMLAIAVAAAVLALAGLAVSIATNMTERRAQSALLAALGVSPSAQARQLCLEALMLSAPAAAAGLALGAVLGWLLVPAVTLTSGAVAPVPAALTEFAWSRAVPLAIAVAALPVLVAAVTVLRRPDPATRLRTAEAT